MKSFSDWNNYVSAVQARDQILPFNPPVIFLETVRGCPHSCAMCHFGRTTVQCIQSDLLKLIEPYFKELEVLAVHGQGEPLLGDLEYFVDQSVINDCVLHMNTSGFLLTKRMAELLSRTRLSIRFSIHAGTAQTYQKIMGQNLNRVRENVSYLVDLTRRSGRKADFWFSFLVLKENVEEIENFIRLAHACGITSVRFMRPLPNVKTLRGVTYQERGFRFSYLEQFNSNVFERFQQVLPACRQLCEELGIRVETGTLTGSQSNIQVIVESLNNLFVSMGGAKPFPLRRIRGFCLAPWFGQPVIDLHGNVRLCCSTTTVIGNLYKSTLSEIWNSSYMQMIRADFARGVNPRTCAYCRGFGLDNYPNNAFIDLDRKELAPV